jgi:hypothetical protein
MSLLGALGTYRVRPPDDWASLSHRGIPCGRSMLMRAGALRSNLRDPFDVRLAGRKRRDWRTQRLTTLELDPESAKRQFSRLVNFDWL